MSTCRCRLRELHVGSKAEIENSNLCSNDNIDCVAELQVSVLILWNGYMLADLCEINIKYSYIVRH